MSAALEIVRAGVQSTLQDAGRFDGAQWGVPQAGAADPLAFALANILLGNQADAAGIEVTLGGLQLRFLVEIDFALTGADCAACLDEQAILPYSRQRAQAGQVLTLKSPVRGLRSYVSLAGGINVPLVLGSRSTLLAAKLGGLAGRALRAGDVLHLMRSSTIQLHPLAIQAPQWRTQLRVIPGPQWGNLSIEAQYLFQTHCWNVAPESNRMGVKLIGSNVQMAIPIEMASQAVLAGTIQLPPNGLPILLLADAQATGGYPILGQVILADLWLAGQYRAGDTIQFVMVDTKEAVLALRQQKKWLEKIQRTVC